MRLGIIKLKTPFSFVSALDFHYLCIDVQFRINKNIRYEIHYFEQDSTCTFVGCQ